MYATVIDLRITFHPGTPTLEQMQKAVGGYIETADRFQTDRAHVTVDVYCNEEGAMIGLPYTYFNQYRTAICGDLVLVGGDNSTGENVELTKDELRIALSKMGFFERDEDI